MQLNGIFIATALLACAAPAMSSVTITFFAGAKCSGPSVAGGTFPDNACITLGPASGRSVSYAGVPSVIQFFESGGAHDACTNGATTTLGGGSGCVDAPAGYNWESVSFD